MLSKSRRRDWEQEGILLAKLLSGDTDKHIYYEHIPSPELRIPAPPDSADRGIVQALDFKNDRHFAERTMVPHATFFVQDGPVSIRF